MSVLSRAGAGLLAAAGVVLLAACPSGQSKTIPPAPTASPGSAQAFFYVAEATDPVLGTSGGRVSAYQVGSDGLLPAAPFASISVVNPRRLLKHPVLPVLYAAGANQIFAFDITGGQLVSLCPEGTGLAPPCATDPNPGANPFDMTIAVNAAGDYVLYVSEAGNGENLNVQTRLAAYMLGPDGELPASPSSQQQDVTSLRFVSSVALTGIGFVYIADVSAGNMLRYVLDENGDLPQPPVSPTPVGVPTPTPSPTPPPVTPTPSPSPTVIRAFGPSRMMAVGFPACPSPTPGLVPTFIYAVAQRQNRIAAWPVSTPAPAPDPSNTPYAGGDLPENPSSESNTRGFYNAILTDPCATHIYGAAFNNGQIDFYELASDGNILFTTQGSTFADTATYPTGLAWFEVTPPGGETQRTVLVSLGGANRVDAYAVQPDGSLPERPFSSTQPIDGTFPADIVAYVP
ncbi:MAG TPA: hypothetical protein VFD92_13330 [Candidatus Binatia bacterium]|nr:hypothetical protein [Candidatus Binatia bacterium]